jgi:hypothetical protein
MRRAARAMSRMIPVDRDDLLLRTCFFHQVISSVVNPTRPK